MMVGTVTIGTEGEVRNPLGMLLLFECCWLNVVV